MKEYIIIVVFLLSSTILINSQPEVKSGSITKEKCYVLALEGGGDKGAYQSGALKGLVDNVPNKEVEWDVVTGVSVGSLDAAAISIFDIGKESEATDFLINTWKGIKGKGNIYQNYWGGVLEGLLFKNGLYDTSPLRDLLKKEIEGNVYKRKFVCGATNFITGEFETWDEETLYKDEYNPAISSSSAFPVIFPLVQFRGNYYMDGGVKHNLDIASGINKCLDMGYVDEKIVVDTVLLNSKVLSQQDATKVHPLGVLTRVFEIFGYDNAMRDIDYAKKAFPKVNFRYVVAPTKKLPSGAIPLVFSPSQIEEMIEIGLEDAKNVIIKGEGKHFESLLEEYLEDRRKNAGRREKRTVGKKETVTDINNSSNNSFSFKKQDDLAKNEQFEFLS